MEKLRTRAVVIRSVEEVIEEAQKEIDKIES